MVKSLSDAEVSITDVSATMEQMSAAMEETSASLNQVNESIRSSIDQIKESVSAVNIAVEESANGVTSTTETAVDLTPNVKEIEEEADANREAADLLNNEVNKFKLEYSCFIKKGEPVNVRRTFTDSSFRAGYAQLQSLASL